MAPGLKLRARTLSHARGCRIDAEIMLPDAAAAISPSMDGLNMRWTGPWDERDAPSWAAWGGKA